MVAEVAAVAELAAVVLLDEELEPAATTRMVLLTVGHAPLLVHDLKWIVCVPAAKPTLMTSISCAVAPRVSAPLSIENPNAVGSRPSHPTLCARTQTGDWSVVPSIGLAIVTSAARAGFASISPEKQARATRANRFAD
jgi:hypothetical protein